MRVKGLLFSLLLLLVACGTGLTLTGTPLPEQLQGQWQTSITSSSETLQNYLSEGIPKTVYIPQYGGGNTIGIIFFFYPDGRYQHKWTRQTFDGACVSIVQWWEQGTVSLTGQSLTLQPSEAKYGAADSCTGLDVHGPARGSTRTLGVKSDQDDTGWPLLLLGYPGGDLMLEKCRECE